MQPKLAQNYSGNTLDKALLEIGLSETERTVYLTSLAAGPLTITELAKLVNLQRPYLHTVIKTLKDKGLAPSDSHYRRSFAVEPPTVIIKLLKQQRGALENLTTNLITEMPTFLASYKQGERSTRILLYEGQEKFYELYDRILEEEGSKTVYFGEAELFLKIVAGERLNDWMKKRLAKKIAIKSLMIDSPMARTIPTNADLLRQTRYIKEDDKTLYPASFQVFGKSVIFWQPHTPVAVVLQDEYISKLHRSIFEMLWENGIDS